MRSFVVPGTKFTAHGHTWVADVKKEYNSGTAFLEYRQMWRSKKTWLVFQCCHDVARETIRWKVDKYSTAKTRSGAAALAASMTREQLDNMVDLLSSYGDETEKRYANMILKKKGHVNLIIHLDKE